MDLDSYTLIFVKVDCIVGHDGIENKFMGWKKVHVKWNLVKVQSVRLFSTLGYNM